MTKPKQVEDVGRGRSVLIVGGGIAGLSAGIALKQLGFQVTILEAAPTLAPAGAGILLAPNAMQSLNELGCAQKVQAKGHILKNGMNLTNYRRELIQDIRAFDEKEEFGFYSTAIHRSALQEALLDELGAEHVQTGKRSKRVEEADGKVTLWCEDGTEYKADWLLGADGIHSVIRQHLFPETSLRYSGETCWRGVSNCAAQDDWAGTGYEMWGHGIRLGILPISDTQSYWFATEKAPAGGKDPAPEATKEKLIAQFAHFVAPAKDVLEQTPADKIMRHDLYDFRPIPKWSKGRIGLIGDAAHATTPNMGQGGCQALEDSWGLTCALREHDDLEAALTSFQQRRQEKARLVVKNSYTFGKLAQVRNPLLCWLRNWFLSFTPQSVIKKQLKQLYNIR